MGKTQHTAVGFEDGVRATSQGMCVVSRNWRKQGTDFPLELPEEMMPCQHLDFSIVWPKADFQPTKL